MLIFVLYKIICSKVIDRFYLVTFDIFILRDKYFFKPIFYAFFVLFWEIFSCFSLVFYCFNNNPYFSYFSAVITAWCLFA